MKSPVARYDFEQLVKFHSGLAPFVRPHPVEGETIDFNDPQAVKHLNTALLKFELGLSWWDIPEGHLCPPVPGRKAYVEALAQLLGQARGPSVRVLDVGVGANCIYPLLGNKLYGWSYVGSDVSQDSLGHARRILDANQIAAGVDLRLQQNPERVFQGIILPGEKFSATQCNPPFHASAAEAAQGTLRKRRNLRLDVKSPLNFGGKHHELWCPGGEFAFIRKMVEESAELARQCKWFTTLVSKEGNLRPLRSLLDRLNASEVQVLDVGIGQKKARVLAWRFP